MVLSCMSAAELQSLRSFVMMGSTVVLADEAPASREVTAADSTSALYSCACKHLLYRSMMLLLPQVAAILQHITYSLVESSKLGSAAHF